MSYSPYSIPFSVGVGQNILMQLILIEQMYSLYFLTLVLLNPDIPCFANSVDPDQLASEEAN